MAETRLTVNTFEMGTPKESAVKVLEEAAEAFGAWQALGETRDGDFARVVRLNAIGISDCIRLSRMADEIADVIQAACNLAARYDLDMPAAMERCERRNRDRGRYDEPMSEDARRVFDRLMRDSEDGR